jgi:hypothetical protein
MNIPRDNLPRDPNDIDPRPVDPLAQEPLSGGETRSTAERNEMRRAESGWGMLPGLFGIVILIALGLMIFSGRDSATTPDRTRSTDVQTPATTPKTTPTQPQ